MPSRRRSDDEEDSEVEDLDSSREKRHKKKSRNRSKSKSRSRSRDRDKEKRRHKKHKKEKKKHKKRRSRSEEKEDGDGGDTPKGEERREETPEVEAQRLPGLGKYDSDGSEEGEIEAAAREAKDKKEVRKEVDAKEELRKDEVTGRERDEEKRGRDRDEGRIRDRDEKRSRDIGRRSEGKERDGGGRLEGKERGERRTEGRDRDRGDRDRGRYNRDHEKGEGGREQYRREEGELGDGGKRDTEDEKGGSSHVISLSIEETNKLREKLGLKPLNTANMPATSAAVEEEEEEDNLPGTLIPGENVRHLAPEHWGQKARTAKLKEKLQQRKEKRSYDSKLSSVRGLGDDDSDDDAANWVKRQKQKTKEKEEAAKKEKMLMELDDEFGVGDIVTESLKEKSKKEYKARDLAGLRVEHAAEDIKSGKETVLILQDGDILGEDYENVLVNVNIVDDERTKKSLQNIKDGKAGYKAYDNEIVDELTGDVQKKQLLYQYNEEIEGQKKDSFKIDEDGEYNEEVSRARELAKIRHKLKLESVQSLSMPEPKMALDYYTEQEMATFKKPKKKRKVRKKILKADDLVKMANPDTLLPTGFGSKVKKRAARIIDDDEVLPDGRLPKEKVAAPGGFQDTEDDVHYDDLPVVGDLTGVRVDTEDDHKQVSSALDKIKAKLKQKKKHFSLDSVAETVIARRDLDDDNMDIDEDIDQDTKQDMILDQTQEFCRGLGDIGHYEITGMGESVSSELLDFERSLQTERGRAAKEHSMVEEHYEKKEKRGTWAEIEGETVEEGSWKEGTKRKSVGGGKGGGGSGGHREMRPAILEEETSAGGGLGAALKLARDKGYLDQEEKKIKNQGLNNLKAQNYSIDDKAGQDDDKNSRRGGGRQGGGYSGPTSSFSEKKGYKPEVLLEYVDDKGRAMSSKEAFRYLSHKFHGKGSGKLKTEKRHRKIMEDDLMQKMSSTDTPLGTLQRLQNKTKELATPYVVLSGNKQAMGGHTTLKK